VSEGQRLEADRYRVFLSERNDAMSEEFSSSTVTDTEFDIVEELKTTVTDLEKEVKPSGNKKISENSRTLSSLSKSWTTLSPLNSKP